MSFPQWSGGPTTVFQGNTNTSFGTIGSVLCLEFAKDIGLMDLECPGLNSTYQLQFDLTVTK